MNQVFAQQSQAILSGSQIANSTTSSSSSNNSGQSSNGGNMGGSGGNGGSGGGGNHNGPDRFVHLAVNASKADVREIFKTNHMNLPPDQVNKVLYTLGSGRMDTINVKLMNNGEVRIAAERSGQVEGYQRMSFGINQEGRTRVVQTAFDSNDNLIRQKPGEAKNNLYDVKNRY
jgi:hypothetical protein